MARIAKDKCVDPGAIENWFADEIAPGKHAILLLDQVGWQFMRDNWLSNRVFHSYDNLLDHCCDAWNRLVDQLWKIMTIGMRDWTYRS